MDQQHQNYESFNDFGFVNAFSAGSENNYSINQQESEMNSKTLNELGLPAIMSNNQGFDARAIETPPSLFDLSNPQYPQMQYHHQLASNNVNTIEQRKTSENNYNVPDVVNDKSVQKLESVRDTLSKENISKEGGESSKKSPEPCSSKSVPSSTVSFDPTQNLMMKALGVVRKDVLGANSSKKRKRIVLLNDEDSDDTEDLKKEVFDKSDEQDESSATKNDNSPSSEADNESDQEETENLTDIGALKAKFLLKNAVIIQGPDKKKKKRLLDSDDEEQVHTTSIDDIGLVNENENEEESFENDILITEPIIAIENTDMAQEMSEEPTCAKIEDVDLSVAAIGDEKLEAEVPPKSPEKTKAPIIKDDKPTDQQEVNKETNEGTSVKSQEDTEIDPSMSVEAILENIKPMADDDEFFKFEKSSDENDKSITNDEYFGTPDKLQQQQQQQGAYQGKKRGPKPGSKRIPKDPDSLTQRRKRGDRYEEDFVDDSDSGDSSDSDYSGSSDSTSNSSDVQEVHTEKRPRGRPPLLKKPPSVLIQTKTFSVTKVPIRKTIMKRDRFYDRSRDIPNDVYFGDVNVPLHVLHTRWGSDDDSDHDDDRYYERSVHTPRPYSSTIPSTSKSSMKHLRPQFTYIHDFNDEPKLSSLKEFIHLCGIKVNYQKLFDGIKSSDHKCALLRRILAQKGMQGEPTVAKCKEIRRELQAKRESAELDKSVIITTGAGRTRRATRNASRATSYAEDSDDLRVTTPTVVQPETLQTLSKIRQVIDSDSE